MSLIVAMSSEQYSHRFVRLKNASSRARSFTEQRPHHAGAQKVNCAINDSSIII